MAVLANIQPIQRVVAPVPAQPAAPSSSLSIKVWKAVSFVFAVLARVGALVVLGAVLSCSISIWHALTSFALLVLAKKSSVARDQMHDFENPEELQRLRASAPHMSYSELKNAFKWSDVKQYNLVAIDGPNGLRQKVLLFLATPANFQDMKSMFGVPEMNCLLEHGIIDIDIAGAVRGDNQGRIQQLLRPV